MATRFKQGCLGLTTIEIVLVLCRWKGNGVAYPGDGGGRLGRVSSGGVRSKVVSGDGCRSDGTT